MVFTHPERSNKAVVDTLMKNRIVTSFREGRIRVSPHFYNTDEQIDKLLRTLL